MSMKSYMKADLSELFDRDMPAECRIGAQTITVLIDDMMNDEIEGFGGPESIETQRVHFKISDKSSIEIGSPLSIRQKPESGEPAPKWKIMIVLSSITSADGNELIATVRAT